jgi:hypothetical protein
MRTVGRVLGSLALVLVSVLLLIAPGIMVLIVARGLH